MAQLVKGNRGGSVLIFQGYRYQKNRQNNHKIYWRCWRKDCSVFVQTSRGEDLTILLQPPPHNHAEEDDLIRTSASKQALVDAVRMDPSAPVKRVYNMHTSGRRRQDELPEFSTVRSSMNRVRSQLVPAIPHDIDDVVFEDEWAQTWEGERFVLHQDNDWGLVVFSTVEAIETIGRCSTIFMDGTFKTCPRPYMQMLTIHGKLFGRVLPLVTALMTGKTIGQYRQVIQSVKTALRRNTGHRFRPGSINCDFEQAILSACETELPGSTVQGCYFHFTQNMWKKVQELGLSADYRTDERLRKCLRKFFALGYLPLPLVRMNFVLHAQSRRTRRLCRRYPDLTAFITYMQANYIDGNFPPALWNVHTRDMDTRTNNHVECKCTHVSFKVLSIIQICSFSLGL